MKLKSLLDRKAVAKLNKSFVLSDLISFNEFQALRFISNDKVLQSLCIYSSF